MSMFKKVLTVAGFGLAAGLMSGGQAEALNNGATSASADIDVSATVVGACRFVGDSTLDFGQYDPVNGSAATGTLQLNCTAGNTYAVAVNNGLHFGSGTRNLEGGASGTDRLGYSICQQDMSVTGNTCTAWNGASTVSFLGDGTDKDLPVYGWIASGANPTEGSYADTISVSVNF
jgi:spore coat protein U-like protein